MTDIEQALVELEYSSRLWRAAHSAQHTTEDSLFNRMCQATDSLAALRVKEARENALYAPQWTEDEVPERAGSLIEITSRATMYGSQPYALHPFDKAEGKYTGEVITGDALTKLLNGER